METHRHTEKSAWVARSGAWRRTTQAAIDFQMERVAELAPGGAAHRKAVEVLLLLQDTMHVLGEAHAMLLAANEALQQHEAIRPARLAGGNRPAREVLPPTRCRPA